MKRWIFNRIDSVTLRSNRYYNFFMETKDWPLWKLTAYQEERLKELSKTWNLGLRSWEDFYDLPLTSKEDIFTFTPKDGGNYFVHETSGSTGEPRRVYVPRETWYRKMAMFRRSWSLLGRKEKPVLRLIAGKAKFAWYDWWRNVYPLNYREIQAEHINTLVGRRPFLIHGPGGATRVLVEAAALLGYHDILKGTKIMWLGQSSEGHRERLEELCRSVHESYGLAELPTVANPCEYSTHTNPETGIIEIVKGEVIVTDFNNNIMPVIRYRTGDTARVEKSECPCGMKHPVMYDVKGRRSDYYFGPEVRKPIGWWIVSPISHKFLDLVAKWRVDVEPKKGTATLHVILRERNADMGRLGEYTDWFRRETGLECKVIEETSANDWKRELVVVK